MLISILLKTCRQRGSAATLSGCAVGGALVPAFGLATPSRIVHLRQLPEIRKPRLATRALPAAPSGHDPQATRAARRAGYRTRAARRRDLAQGGGFATLAVAPLAVVLLAVGRTAILAASRDRSTTLAAGLRAGLEIARRMGLGRPAVTRILSQRDGQAWRGVPGPGRHQVAGLPPSAPYIVIDDGTGCEAALETTTARLGQDGWRVVDGLETRPALARVVLRGTVASPSDAATALLAALDGFGLLVRATADEEVVDRLVDDLRRLGPVDHHGGSSAAGAPVTAEGRAILGFLAEGHTLGQAASCLGLSRRTADRRLAEARAALGVTRTTEAIALAAREGWLRGGTGG